MNTREDFYTRRRQFRLSCSQPLRWRKSMRELRSALQSLLAINPLAPNSKIPAAKAIEK
jgi:hypothetical protein